MRDTIAMYCPNPRCPAGWFEVERVGTGYGALWLETDEAGNMWRVAADEPTCPKCGFALMEQSETPGAEGYLEMLEKLQ